MSKDIKELLKKDEKDKLKKKKFPAWEDPMLATLTHERFSDKEWIYERKIDGERCLVFIKNGKVTLKSRNDKDIGNSYPEITDALEKSVDKDCVLDGEIAAFEGNVTSFSKLQGRMHVTDREKSKKSKVKVYIYLFDILYYDGFDTTGLPLATRKKVLRAACDFKGNVRYMQHRNEKGEDYYEEACEKGWEGVIAKDKNATYTHGRSKRWLKFKCSNEEEFVIGGFTEPQGERKGFGALLIGIHKNGDLLYAGKVGTGYDDETLEKLGKKMRGMERKTSPFKNDVKEENTHWVKPELVAQIGFTEWTSGGKLRHPKFIGLRRDKDAKDVKV